MTFHRRHSEPPDPEPGDDWVNLTNGDWSIRSLDNRQWDLVGNIETDTLGVIVGADENLIVGPLQGEHGLLMEFKPDSEGDWQKSGVNYATLKDLADMKQAAADYVKGAIDAALLGFSADTVFDGKHKVAIARGRATNVAGGDPITITPPIYDGGAGDTADEADCEVFILVYTMDADGIGPNPLIGVNLTKNSKFSYTNNSPGGSQFIGVEWIVVAVRA